MKPPYNHIWHAWPVYNRQKNFTQPEITDYNVMVPLESLIKKEFITDVSEQRKNGENTWLCTRCSRDEPMINIFKNPLWIQHSQLHHRAKKWVSNNWPKQQLTMHDPWSPNYVTKIISWTNSTDTSINIIIVKCRKCRKDLSITKPISRLSSCNVTIFQAC